VGDEALAQDQAECSCEGGDLTIVDVIRSRVRTDRDRPALVFLERGEREAERVTYGELDRAARALAAALLDAGAEAKPVLVALPSGVHFVRAFLGCLYAGAYAVPAPYPFQRRNWDRIAGIMFDVGPTVVLTTDEMASDPMFSASCCESSTRIIPIDAALSIPPIDAPASPEPADIAFIQYTSGSTTRPKGVVVTYRNLAADQAMIAEAFGDDENSVGVHWLPPHHDMGLIGGILQPLYVGALGVFMSPFAFLQRPVRWLRAISDYRATTSGGPNFGYELCLRAIGASQFAGLDLSSWRLAFSGAEPVRAATMRKFAERFGACGFDPAALYPCYGLAEATLFVSGRNAGSGISCRAAPLLSETARAALTSSRRELVSCGWSRQEGSIAILALDRAEPVGGGETGEICVAGDNVSPGFWSRELASVVPDTDRQVDFAGRTWLRTGDLGFIADGELFVAGRLKDMMIIYGANIYAEDVEATVMALPEAAGLRLAACFGIERERSEAMVVVGELIEKSLPPDGGVALVDAISKAVGDAFGTVPADVLLVGRGNLPVTASGKIQRGLTRARFLAGELRPLATGYRPLAVGASAS
jgi:acyl-CoA synthetase (AMP-forming)/AMP-acid ligase II